MTALLLLAFAIVPDVESGPKPGEKVPALKVSAVTGEFEGKDVDYPGERKAATTVYLVVNAEKFSRPMARFMRELDGKLADEKAAGVAVWVGGDADKNKDYLPKVQMSIKLANTAFCVSSVASPDGWSLNTDAHLTAVIVADGKVVKSFAFVSVNETDVKGVLEELKKLKK